MKTPGSANLRIGGAKGEKSGRTSSNTHSFHRILASPFLLLIHLYRLILSPVLHALTGPLGGGCRFQPTCSKYALEALHIHPLPKALWLILRRIGRCHPWGGSGHDPVPPV